MVQVLSYQVADSIDVKGFRLVHKEGLSRYDADELFYETGPGIQARAGLEDEGSAIARGGSAVASFVYVFKYGVVCFLNYDDERINEFLARIAPFCKMPFEVKLSEEFQVEVNARENKLGYNTIAIVNEDVETLRLIMLNVSQSVALDYFSEQTNVLLEETNSHTLTLEQKGKLAISGRNLKKYIGKTLYLKNRISENLYIFDSPPETWEDENLNRIDVGLKRTFDLQERFRDIKEGLEIIKENLELFKDLLQYRNSTVLEWIIIVLVAVEVLNLLIDKLGKIMN